MNSIPLNFASQYERNEGCTFPREIPEDCCTREDTFRNLNMQMPLKPLIFIPIY